MIIAQNLYKNNTLLNFINPLKNLLIMIYYNMKFTIQDLKIEFNNESVVNHYDNFSPFVVNKAIAKVYFPSIILSSSSVGKL